MPTIDLKNYIAVRKGPWTKDPEAFMANEFVLSQSDDEVTFTGPIAISVTAATMVPASFLFMSVPLVVEWFLKTPDDNSFPALAVLPPISDHPILYPLMNDH